MQINKTVNPEFNKSLAYDFLTIIYKKGTFTDVEKRLFNQLVNELEIGKDVLTNIKNEVNEKTNLDKELTEINIRHFLNKFRDNLYSIIDPFEVDDFISEVSVALGVKAQKIDRLSQLKFSEELSSKFGSDCRRFYKGRKLFYKDLLFTIPDLLKDKAREGCLKLLKLRILGKHSTAIAWLNKTDLIDEPLRLYLSARFYLECQQYKHAKFLLNQGQQLGMRNELYNHELFFIDCAHMSFEDSFQLWCELRHLNPNNLSVKQAHSAIRSLIDGLIARNMFHLAIRNIKISQNLYPELNEILKAYEPIFKNVYTDFLPTFYGYAFLTIQTLISVVLVLLGVFTFSDYFTILKFLLGIETAGVVLAPNIYQYFNCAIQMIALTALLPSIFFNLKAIKYLSGHQACGWVSVRAKYIQVVAFSKTYHFAKVKLEQALLITHDHISLAGKLFLRALPLWPSVNYIYGNNLITGKYTTVPLIGVISGKIFSETLQIDSQTPCRPFSRLGLRFIQVIKFCATFVERRINSTFYLFLGLVGPITLYFTHSDNINHTNFWIAGFAWLAGLIFIPLISRSISINSSKFTSLVDFNQPQVLFGLMLLTIFGGHYLTMGISGVIPTILFTSLGMFILFSNLKNPTQQYYIAEIYRHGLMDKVTDQPEEIISGWMGCSLGYRYSLPVVQQHVLVNESTVAFVKSIFNCVIDINILNSSNNPLIVHAGEKQSRVQLGSDELITSVHADDLRKIFYILKIPCLFKNLPKSRIEYPTSLALIPVVILIYGAWIFFQLTEFQDHDYDKIEVNIHNVAMLEDENIFDLDQETEQLYNLVENKYYQVLLKENQSELHIIQAQKLTYGQMESVINNSNIPELQSINIPYLNQRRILPSNILNIGLWYSINRNSIVNTDLFGKQLEQYCNALEMQVMPDREGGYRCGFAVSTKQLASFIRRYKRTPKFINTELLKFVLREDGSLLNYLPLSQKGNETLALAAIQNSEKAWQYIEPKLRENSSFILKTIKINGRLLSVLSPKLRNDPGFVLAALEQDVKNYEIMNQELWDNQDIVSFIIKKEGLALRFASKNLRNQKKIVQQAIRQNPLAINFASENLQKDNDLRKSAKLIDQNIEFVFIPPGERVHPATKKLINLRGFFISTHEIRRTQFQDILGYNPGTHSTENHPVDSVELEDVNRFIASLNTLVGKDVYRLPSLLEWEHATKANSNTNYFFGNNSDELQTYAWYVFNSNNQSQPIGTKLPNPWGLYDVYGNVSELVQPFAAKYYKSRGFRLSGVASNILVIGICGGSYKSNMVNCQPLRDNQEYRLHKKQIGFRLVRSSN